MSELHFKGKEFVYNHHLSVPYRPLVADPAKSIGEGGLDGNLIIHGDNLHALKALMPRYAGKVDCIFIDPPYNTGNEGWCYNDNVNSPMMQEWLKSNPVGIEDALRHDKWCAMMWPRLRLLFELLSEHGVIFTCIDDNELYNLKLMLDELSGTSSNWIGTIIWKNVTDNNPTRIAVEHEYIVCFSKNKEAVERVWKSKLSAVKDLLVSVGEDFISRYGNDQELESAYKIWFKAHKPELWPLDRYKYIDRGGIYTGSQSVHNPGKEGYRYDVLHPVTGEPCKQPLMGYRFPEETMKDLLKEERVLFGDDHNKIIELKLYAKDYSDKLPSVIELDGRIAAYELREIFPDRKKAFDNPKPSQLVESVLSFCTTKDALVLDSFAGSGTTAHAVIKLNQADDGNRRFILVEGEPYADEITRERVHRVVCGIAKTSGEQTEPTRNTCFTYCTLGDPIDIDKILTGEAMPDYQSLGSWLFHTATGASLDISRIDEASSYLGESDSYFVWLLYKPDLSYLKSKESALTLSLAEKIAKAKEGKRHLVFAPAKFVPNKALLPLGIEFAPLPFALYQVER
jgi:adenine-specific DNA-methyltransferase